MYIYHPVFVFGVIMTEFASYAEMTIWCGFLCFVHCLVWYILIMLWPSQLHCSSYVCHFMFMDSANYISCYVHLFQSLIQLCDSIVICVLCHMFLRYFVWSDVALAIEPMSFISSSFIQCIYVRYILKMCTSFYRFRFLLFFIHSCSIFFVCFWQASLITVLIPLFVCVPLAPGFCRPCLPCSRASLCMCLPNSYTNL